MNATGDKDVIALPVNNVAKEVIGPFVMKLSGANAIPGYEIVNGKYKFNNHDHELSLISLDDEEEEEENSDDDGDDEFLPRLKRNCVVCDGCTTPIYEKNYLSCSECKYFLHWVCFNLPSELPSLPLHQSNGHDLILKTTPKLEYTRCWVCCEFTNGMFYRCTNCMFQVDIKCASLPDIIKYAAHRHHHLNLIKNEFVKFDYYMTFLCEVCGRNIDDEFVKFDYYECSICKIYLHPYCALLPATITNPTWDRHPLLLTFDASLDHPSDFYCEICEEQMNPKKCMYHCRPCDFSIHPSCFPTASGSDRNIKFGKLYINAAVHPHTLVHQFLTKKLHCDLCKRKAYGCDGFQCASDKCDFFMCFDPCGKNHRDEFQVVD